MSLAVLITYHNERGLLTECLQSVQAQTIPVDEILIYDDASSFPPEPYIPDRLCVRVIRGARNLGPGAGRNALLRATRAAHIHFHDSDDLFHPNWSCQVRKQLADGIVDAVFTEVNFFGADRTVTNERVLGLRSLERGEELTRFCVRGCLLPASGTYKRILVSRIGGYRENLWQSEDFDFHVRLAASGIVYRIIDEPLVLCRSHASNRSRDHVEVGTCGVQAIELLARELPIQYRPDLADRAAAIGASLFRLGAREEARAAFNLAFEIGPPQLNGQRKSYRALGRLFGLEFAERTGALYRRVFPESMRRALGH